MMVLSCVGSRRAGLSFLAAAVAFAATVSASTDAEARRGKKRHQRTASAHSVYAPPYAAMVVDANTGRVMHAVNEDEPRHPASVTKVMTLYMLFEQLERGALKLDSELSVSRHAASQAPSKLGLAPGSTIEVEDAIKALVTKSANDVAAAIAENIAGSEEEFAERMTRKARQLGMSGTVYRNASGLPNREQITTARDLTILARAIQERFPRYYTYFQTRTFNFAGRAIGNHNRLLGRVEGVDGIKTGFTNASGFNLMTSARTDGRFVVGVVLGGRSGASRDNIMAGLIRTNLARASGSGNASVLADTGERRGSVRLAAASDVETTAATAPVRPGRPLDLNALRPVVAPAANAAATTTPAGARSAAAAPQAVLAYASTTDLPRAAPIPPQKIDARLPAAPAAALVAPPEPPVRAEMAYVPEPPRPERETARAEPEPRRDARASSASTWVIQLAAEESETKARDVLDQAKSRSGRLLSRASGFTERVVRGSATLYRARFSGFAEADTAQEACKTLKRSGFACFATRS